MHCSYQGPRLHVHSNNQSWSNELVYTWELGKCAGVLMIKVLAAYLLSLRLFRFAVAVHSFYIFSSVLEAPRIYCTTANSDAAA